MDIDIRAIWILLFYFVCASTGKLHRLTNLNFNLESRTSGIAVTDMGQDGQFDILVAVLRGANKVIHFNQENQMYEDNSATTREYAILKDTQARTVSVSACDIDGDGVEEIYIHNVNDVYSDVTSLITPDRLIWKTGETITDVFNDPVNRKLAPRRAGYSVACIDAMGDGRYAFLVTSVTQEGSGVYLTFSVNNTQADDTFEHQLILAETSRQANVHLTRDGRGISVGPVVGSDSFSDIFVTNDNSYFIGSSTFRHDGSNVLLKNNGDGTFTDVATDYGVQDADENGRGIAMGDYTGDHITDIMYVNWLGPGRLVQLNEKGNTSDADERFKVPGPSKVLLTADLNNDGYAELVRGNTDEENFYMTENEVFSIKQAYNKSSSVEYEPFHIGDNEFPHLHITGITASDLDGDGYLELFISHRPYRARTFSVYENSQTNNNWLRIMPLTKYGAPARGSKVVLILENDAKQVAIIGGGCGYMCQMEPVAHFGLGKTAPRELTVTWNDGHTVRKFVNEKEQNKLLIISYNGRLQTLNNSHGGGSISKANVCLPNLMLPMITLCSIFYGTTSRM